MARRLCSVVCCCLAVAVVRPSAWQLSSSPPASTQQTPTFRARVDSVTVDAIVTDKQGRPVVDLTAADFEITENKKLQAVQAFKLVQIDGSRDTDPAMIHDITSLDEQQRQTARDDVRLLVIFLDDYHVRRGNAMSMRLDIAKFVSQLTPHDLVAVMYPLTPVSAITFSRDHDGTANAVRAFEGRKYEYSPRNPYEERYADYPPEMQEVLRRQVTISALEGLATYLGTLKDGKKLVLLVSEGLAGTLPPGVQTTGTLLRPIPPASQQSQQDRAAFFNQVDVLDEMKRIFAAAARSNTSIYTLDPRGLATSEFQINDNVSSDNDRRTLNEAQDSLRVLAGNTDGRAIVNRNTPGPELAKMLNDVSAYYLLGYTSTEAPRDGKFHEIQVRVKRKDLEVRARKGYWAFSADDVAKATSAPREGPTPAVQEALSALAATSRNSAVRVWTGSQRGADGKDRVTLAWEAAADPAAQTAARVDTSETIDHISLVATSIYGDTLFRGPVPREAQATRPSGRVTFDSPPGAVRLQIVVENAKGGRIDRQDESVDVPDLTGVGPLLTTPMVFRGRTARDLQQIRAADSPMPSVTREFSRTERLLLRFQAYGPGDAKPMIAMALLNNLGKSMATLPAPTRLPDGTFECELGLGSLAPGSYLIQISAEADSGKTQTLLAIRVTG